jgi:xylulokinase
MRCVVGIDASTTATKAVLVDESGAVRAVGVSEYGYETPHPGWAEQDPGLWWDGTIDAVRQVLASVPSADIVGVGLTGQMHGLVMLDAAGSVIRPALLWNDQRTAAQCDALRDRLGPDHLIALTGNDALTGFTAPKVAWVRDHEPDHHAAIASICLPKDYVRFRLTGDIATDMADGSGTLLMDVAHRRWSDEMLDAVGLTSDQVPVLHEGPEVTGTVTAEAADLTGLPVGIPVVAGGGDQAANAVGVGAVTPTVGAISIGTSGVVFVPSELPVVEPGGRVHSFCHAVPGQWHAMGVMLSAAGSLRWYRDTIAPAVPFADLVAEAAEVPPGADGVRFLPYLTGERTPHADPDATGAFVGLTVRHGRAHLTRAVLEGVAFGLGDGFRLMVDAGVPVPDVFRASGGGTRSRLWLQIVADVLGVDIATIRTVEGAAFGAALLSGVGSGVWTDVAAATGVVETTDVVHPGPESVALAVAHEEFRSLYPALNPSG